MEQKPDKPSPLLKVKPLSQETKQAILRRIAITGGSMLLSFWVIGFYRGWAFAAGYILLIFLHECGHVWAGRQLKLEIGDMVFIPFMGAFVMVPHTGKVEDKAFVGLMGPVFGTIGTLICVILVFVTHSRLFLGLAAYNNMLTLFNLFPVRPLDGGSIAPVLLAKTKDSPEDTSGVILARDQLALGLAYLGLITLLFAVYFIPDLTFIFRW